MALSLINTLAAGSSLLLAFLILTTHRNVNRIANQWLGIFMLAVSGLLLDETFTTHQIYLHYPHCQGLTDLPVFGMAPALYLSVYHFVLPGAQPRRSEWLHFIPVFLFFLLNLPFFLSSRAYKHTVAIEQSVRPIAPNNPQLVLLALLFLQILIYWVLSYRKLRAHQRHVRVFAANVEAIQLKWLQYFLWGVLFMVIIWGGEIAGLWGFALHAPIAYFLGIFGLGYFALRQREVFPFKPQDIQAVRQAIEINQRIGKKKRLLFTPEQLTAQQQHLNQIMASQKPYLDNELSLPKLASIAAFSVHELSYLLNDGFGENFFQFVNRYRVEEAKRLLQDPQYDRLNLLGIAYEAGFNSKTTFNTTFKKHTGISPGDFRKSAHLNISNTELAD